MNTPKCIVIISLIGCIIFFSLGFYNAAKAGITGRNLLVRVDANLRKMEIGPGLTEYINISQKREVKTESAKRIIITSTFTSINVTRSQREDIEISISGTIKNEISDNILEVSEKNGVKRISIAEKKVSNPTSTGLTANIIIPENYDGTVEIGTESGEVRYDSTAESEVFISTISGDINYGGGRDNKVTLRTENGRLFIFTIGLKADIFSSAGTVDIMTGNLEGSVRTGSGYVHVQSDTMTSGVNIFTDTGEIEYSSRGGYKYEVMTGGKIKFKDESRFSPLRGEFMKGQFTLRISSSKGNVYLE